MLNKEEVLTMNNKNRHSKKKIKRVRITITFIVVVILTVIGGSLAFLNFSSNEKNVQALDTSSNENLEKINENQKDNNTLVTAKNPEVEDVAFVEKYLQQQMKNQMPDGADGKKVAYLTFDDGPSITVTPKILDILKAENVHATFFVVGKRIEENETSSNLLKRELSEGNAIGIHSYSHDDHCLFPKNKINVQNCITDFEKADQSIKKVLGQDFSTRALRFPWGHMTWSRKDPQGTEAIDKALAAKDLHQVDWNSLSADAEGAPKNAEQLTQEVIRTAKDRQKAVILMHDTYGKEESAKALPGIIKYLKKQGFEFRIIK